ncbi:MAG: cell filamentation protein Fic [Chloroflexi bacterium]|nr:MAG: cell filamentation protein Fic [Chloroflexota bacterium]
MSSTIATSPSGAYVRDVLGNVEYWAFVPAPLPPELYLSPDTLLALSAADRAVGELSGLGRALPNPHLLIQPFIYREAVLSSRIEGTVTTAAELYAYRAGQLPLPGVGAPEADVREVANYAAALEHGLRHLGDYPLSLWCIRGLHRMLLEGVRGDELLPGEFRRVQNYIGSPRTHINQARYVPPPPYELDGALAAFEAYMQGDDPLPPLVRLALIHYQFEAIHPFMDGNGRVGRLHIALLLGHWRLLSQPLLYVSAYFESNRQEYYDLLLGVSRDGAWEPWVLFFLQGVEQQARDGIKRAQLLQDVHARWKDRLAAERTSATTLRLADYLLLSPIVTVPQLVTARKTSHPTAMRAVQKLVDLGILSTFGTRSYRQAFVADDVLAVISDLEHSR